MATKKETILDEGMRLILQQGYNSTGIQQVLKAANIPKGSFYFYFDSKEDFGREVLRHFVNTRKHVVYDTLLNEELSALERFRAYFAKVREVFENRSFIGGCMIGNFAQELSDTNDMFRDMTEKLFQRFTATVANTMRLGVDEGSVRGDIDIDASAEYFCNSWEGAMLRSKVQKSPRALLLAEAMFMKQILTDGGYDEYAGDGNA